jgi:death on curing protein
LPNSAVQFLSLDEALTLHEQLLTHFGGPPGVRDPGLLESALFRPQTGYYEGLAQMAAALFESLIMNHPFVDGNKRIAFFACDVFLRMNGYKLKVAAAVAHRFIISSLENKQCDYEHLLPWIERHLQRV